METVREMLERRERETLAPWAALSADAVRDAEEAPCPYRAAYQRDRDRVLHCKAFRRLKDKTQVFLSPEGDHYRTRLTHTLEVAQIARTVARALRLSEDLTEAIALAHDLGHTPFGHAGERALDALMEGGFRHYEQGVRVVERIEKEGAGLNLTVAVRDGILRHTGGEPPATLEGQAVRLADRIAYVNHDIDDAARAGVIAEADVPSAARRVLGEGRSARITALIAAAIAGSVGADGTVCAIALTEEAAAVFAQLHAFMFEAVYTNPRAKSEEAKVEGFLARLFAWFCAHPDALPHEFAAIREREGVRRAVCDYVAGMTDGYALDRHERLFVPRAWQDRS